MNKLIEKIKTVTEISYIYDDFEYYTQLFEEFQDLKSNDYELEIWRCNKLIELMDNLRFSVNKEFVRNSLILILTLYSEAAWSKKIHAAQDAKALSVEQKKEYFMVLETEFVTP